MKELLVTCPLCRIAKFTPRGLRAHWCPKKPAPEGNKKHSAPLSREEWQAAVEAAKKAPAQRRSPKRKRGRKS